MPSKVFVVTVCRNASALIEPTMQSVLSQTYPDMEYVLIDGASTDGTNEMIARYASQPGSRIVHWVSEPDKGIYDAMNKALCWIRTRLSGDAAADQLAWVNFMNAGDFFADEHVLEQVFGSEGMLTRASSVDSCMVIGGNTVDMLPGGGVDIKKAEPATVIPVRLPFSHQACFVRVGSMAPKVCLKEGHWHFDKDYPIAADYNLLYQIFWKYGADSFLILDRKIACYRQEGSTSLDNAKRTKGEYLAIQSSHLSWRWVKEYLKWRWL